MPETQFEGNLNSKTFRSGTLLSYLNFLMFSLPSPFTTIPKNNTLLLTTQRLFFYFLYVYIFICIQIFSVLAFAICFSLEAATSTFNRKSIKTYLFLFFERELVNIMQLIWGMKIPATSCPFKQLLIKHESNIGSIASIRVVSRNVFHRSLPNRMP